MTRRIGTNSVFATLGSRRLKLMLLVATLSFFVGTVHAQSTSSALLWDGTKLQGEPVSLDAESMRLNQSTGEKTIARSELVVWQQSVRQPFNSDSISAVSFVNGDLLFGTPLGLDDTELRWLCQLQNVDRPSIVTIPLERIRSLHFSSNTEECVRAANSPAPKLNRDRIQLQNGDWLTGDLIQVDFEELILETAEGETKLPLKNLSQIWFNPELTLPIETSEQSEVCLLTDGSRLTLTNLRGDAQNAWQGESIWKEDFSFRARDVIRILFLSKRVVSLASRTPDEIEYTTYLSDVGQVQFNTNATGHFLRIGRNCFPLGFGMKPRTSITWKLAPEDRAVIAWVGLDSMEGKQGAALFQIETDETVRWEEELLGTNAQAEEVRVDLNQQKQLTLRVGFGPRGDLFDVANWGDVLLLRAGGEAGEE